LRGRLWRPAQPPDLRKDKMEKKLTLNKAWSKCLKQWKYIVENLDSGKPVHVLKEKYIKKHDSESISVNCYFCEYDWQHHNIGDSGCEHCPGRLVDKHFDCLNVKYRFKKKPRAFYRKLLALNAKRKGK